MSTCYPDDLERLLAVCREFREGRIGLDELQKAVWHTVTVVVAVEEARYRGFLQDAEAKLETARFMASEPHEAAFEVVHEVEQRTRAQLL